jgi:hypothetical protein
MKTIGRLMAIGLVVASVGIVMKALLINGGAFLLLLSLTFLSILAFVQCKQAISKLSGSIRILSALMSVTLSIAFIGILFRYMFWSGWSPMLTISIYLFVVISMILVATYREILTEINKKFVQLNLLLPWFWIFVFGSIPYSLTEETFYNNFSGLRTIMTYQEYLKEMQEE